MSDAGAGMYEAAKRRDLSSEELLKRIRETRESIDADPNELEAIIQGDRDDSE